MNPEKIAQDAKVAVTYFNALLAEGMHTILALQLTQAYMGSLLIMDGRQGSGPAKPKEPWES